MPLDSIGSGPPPKPVEGYDRETGELKGTTVPGPTSTDSSGIPPVGGTGPQPLTGTGAPEPEKPKVDMADLAAILMILQDKLSKESIKTSKGMVEDGRQQMKSVHDERMKSIEDWIDKMAEAETKSKGFFGRLFGAIKCVFKGDFHGAAEKMKEAFKESPVTGSSFSIVAACCLMGGPLGLLVAAAIFAPEIMMDPEVQESMVNSLGEKGAMALTITVLIVWGLATGGTTIAQVAAALSRLEGGIHKYQADKLTADGMGAQADADRAKAASELIETLLKKDTEFVRSVMESVASNLRIAMDIIKSQAEAGGAATDAMLARRSI